MLLIRMALIRVTLDMLALHLHNYNISKTSAPVLMGDTGAMADIIRV